MAKVGGWKFDTETMKLEWTEEVYRIHEVDFSYEPIVEKGIAFYAQDSIPLITEAVKRAINNGESFDLELEIITAKGNRKSVHSIGQANFENGKVKSVSGTFQDITERKKIEDKIQSMLKEKEILLREVHHRIKNNIATVSGLLMLQSASI